MEWNVSCMLIELTDCLANLSIQIDADLKIIT